MARDNDLPDSQSDTTIPVTNIRIAERLVEAADLNEQQDGNPFRSRAYRRAADTLRSLTEDVAGMCKDGGISRLMQLDGIGPGIGSAINEMIETGRWNQLDRLRKTVDPSALFSVLPGIGPVLAYRIYDTLGIETLEDLEQAAHDSRLSSVAGLGNQRIAAVRTALSGMLGSVRRFSSVTGDTGPSVGLIIDVDREYRKRSRSGELRKIAPRRFNPEGKRWLPILHTRRNSWQFTVLYSNTARAHELDKTDDWVVVYYYDGENVDGQNTVVTETRGILAGMRVVRGRENECRTFYLSNG